MIEIETQYVLCHVFQKQPNEPYKMLTSDASNDFQISKTKGSRSWINFVLSV